MTFATPETGFGSDGNRSEDRRKAPLRKQTQRPRIGLLLDLVELLLKRFFDSCLFHLNMK